MNQDHLSIIGTLEYNECNYQVDYGSGPTTASFYGAATGGTYEYGLVWSNALWDLRSKGTSSHAIDLILDSIDAYIGEGAPGSFEDAAQWILDRKKAAPSTYSSITYSEILNAFYGRGIQPTEIELDWTIPSGTSITIDGVTLDISTGVQIDVDGTLTVKNSTLNHVSTGTWDGVLVDGTLNLDGATIEDVSTTTGSGSVTCSSCTLES